MICQFKKTFLRDLAKLPANYRKRIESLVFDELPMMNDLPGKLDIRKIQGFSTYYRIRIGDYRIGCEIKSGDRITFYRVKIERTYTEFFHNALTFFMLLISNTFRCISA